CPLPSLPPAPRLRLTEIKGLSANTGEDYNELARRIRQRKRPQNEAASRDVMKPGLPDSDTTPTNITWSTWLPLAGGADEDPGVKEPGSEGTTSLASWRVLYLHPDLSVSVRGPRLMLR
ncbi:hypothetical protein OTU49_003402, partial [Cherax quadricarinatus]